jgi:hypothetical protein
MSKGLKIMTLDATDLLQYDQKTKQVVPSNLTQFYDYYDEENDKTLKLRKRNLFKMKLECSMGLDELQRLIIQNRMVEQAIFKVGFKEATDQVIHVTFKYSKLRSTDPEDKDEKTGKINKYKIKGYTKKSIKDKIYDDGFDLDGIHYVRWIRSGNTARVGNCLFINEKFLNGMNAFTDCGIKPKKRKLNLASFEAYRALVLSSKIGDLEIKPENILLIDDVKSTFTEKVMYTGATKDGKLFTQEKEQTITNKIHDGQSLIDKSLMGEYKDKGMLLLRHKFFKSCCFNTNLQQWFKDNRITEISQLNGQTVATKIEDIKLITTPSSIKYCKFGKKDKWFNDWLAQITKHNKPFGIVKYEKPTKYFGGRLVRTHYQILNTLQIAKEKIKKLLEPTLEYLELLRTDPIAMYHYCEVHSDDEDNDLMMNVKADIIHKMMKLNENFKNTEMYQVLAKRILEDIRSDIKCGRILVNGTYATVLGNPIEMLQAAIGKYEPETTVVGEKTIISTAFDEKQLLACRSPHICAGNIYLPNNLHDVELSNGKHLTDYINLTDNIVVINSVGENTLQRCSGMDMDSDQIMLVDNDIMLDAAKDNYDKFLVPTTDIEPDPLEQDYTSENLSDLDYKTSENLIGEIVNLSQVLNSKLWNEMNQAKSNEIYIKKLYKDICQLSVMSGLEIDKAKKSLKVDNKTELEKIRKKYRNKQGKIEYPKFFRELSRKSRHDSKKTYRYYNTTLDMIGDEIAYKELVIENDKPLALESILNKPDIKKRDIDWEKIKAITKVCEDRAKEDAKLSEVKKTQGKSQYIKKRQLIIENFIDDMEQYKKMNQPTLYTLLTGKDTQKYIDYILQGLLEVKCTTLNKLVRISEKTPTLIEDKNGDYNLYGIKHKKEVA